MSKPIVSQLQALLEQLQALDLQDPDPELQHRLAALSMAAAEAQSHIQRRLQNEVATSDTSSSNQPQSLASVEPTASNLFSEVPAASEDRLLRNSPPSKSNISAPSRPQFPWIPLDLGGTKPSENTFANKDQPRQFGMPLTGVLPLEPPFDLFVWAPESISKLGKPEAERLVPAPAATPPPFGSYPQAPEYVLNSDPDHSYRRGYRYAVPFNTSDREIERERERMLNIQMPPSVHPSRFHLPTRTFQCDPIPGMVQLPMGIPLVHHINGDPKRAVTAVCGHTLETLMQYEEGPKVRALIPRLMTLTWGIAKSNTCAGVPGIFELPGMQTNLRSKNIKAKILVPGDGSYNLASTHGEGEGHGTFMPAVQTNTPVAAATIKEVLEILHKIYRFVMPLCISRFEWDMLEFNSRENNVIAFGGLEPGPTSCQNNASSASNIVNIPLDVVDAHKQPSSSTGKQQPEEAPSDSPNPPPQPLPKPAPAPDKTINLVEFLLSLLRKSIGEQGGIHGDFKDDAIAYTLFLLLFRLPPGSDLGAFLWMRGAIYLRELDQYVLFTSFKGQDLHTGSAPTYVKEIQDAWITQVKKAWISMDDASQLFQRFGPHSRSPFWVPFLPL
ncbi:hypothetical protein B0H10DRAFT_2379738 [Mycena sp. CBHHK59/15]|nr:hypothetical protein B0H10DRAFT_2379738 [Mycena sp. CBHHK59/15]